MADIGLTFGQIAIATATWSGLQSLSLPALAGQRMVHVAPNSTSYPVKELGHLPPTISGVNLLTATDVDDFVIDVRTGSAEQKISFLLGAVEHFVYAYSGDVTSITCLNLYGSATRQYYVGWVFPCSRSKLYKSSDETVVWGS